MSQKIVTLPSKELSKVSLWVFAGVRSIIGDTEKVQVVLFFIGGWLELN